MFKMFNCYKKTPEDVQNEQTLDTKIQEITTYLDRIKSLSKKVNGEFQEFLNQCRAMQAHFDNKTLALTNESANQSYAKAIEISNNSTTRNKWRAGYITVITGLAIGLAYAIKNAPGSASEENDGNANLGTSIAMCGLVASCAVAFGIELYYYKSNQLEKLENTAPLLFDDQFNLELQSILSFTHQQGAENHLTTLRPHSIRIKNVNDNSLFENKNHGYYASNLLQVLSQTSIFLNEKINYLRTVKKEFSIPSNKRSLQINNAYDFLPAEEKVGQKV